VPAIMIKDFRWKEGNFHILTIFLNVDRETIAEEAIG
jgi:hypothetical protein